jgi:hypothetical protein
LPDTSLAHNLDNIDGNQILTILARQSRYTRSRQLWSVCDEFCHVEAAIGLIPVDLFQLDSVSVRRTEGGVCQREGSVGQRVV